jgi:NAD(P)-dependent dehydrogenase (short-subunit alcohol dehydrogenase family)
VSRYTLDLVSRPAQGLGLPSLGEHPLAIHPPCELGHALKIALEDRGIRAEVVDSLAADVHACFLLDGVSPVVSRDEALSLNRAVFQKVRTLAAHRREHGGTVILAQDTGGDFGRSGAGVRAWSSGISALARTAALEWPSSTVRLLDIATSDRPVEETAERLADELTLGGTEAAVGLIGRDERWVLSPQATPCPDSDAMALHDGDVVLVSGGAKGVTAHTLQALADQVSLKFVLLGRSELHEEAPHLTSAHDLVSVRAALLGHYRTTGHVPTPAVLEREVRQIMGCREIRNTIQRLEERGSTVRYAALDVTDTALLTGLVDSVVNEYGPIRGVIHGAGVLADRLIEDKTDAQFDQVFDTKVRGLAALLDATRDQPLRALVLFSSVAAAAGNSGQSDYAMANEVLERVADEERTRRAGTCWVRALGWGPWEGGMVTPELARAFEARGVPLIDLDAGAQALVRELSDPTGPGAVVLGASPDPHALAGRGGPRSARAGVWASHARTPFLAHHQIAGVPVVPIALVFEWITRIAHACRPDLTLQKITDLQVLRPIRLDDFERGTWLNIEATEVSNGQGSTLSCVLSESDGKPLYRATALMESFPFVAPRELPHVSGLSAWSKKPIYDGEVLFHGREFQVIQSLDGIGPGGLEATLEADKSTSWTGGPWRTDPAALDGALQLALLWTQERLGAASLPMSVRSFECYDLSPAKTLRAVLRGNPKGTHAATADVVLCDDQGNARVALRGIELILRPDASPADPAEV